MAQMRRMFRQMQRKLKDYGIFNFAVNESEAVEDRRNGCTVLKVPFS